MPPRKSQPGRWLAACFAVIALLYVGLAATKTTTPLLGLDLRGGTSVILEPQLTHGKTLSKDEQTTAVNIIRDRVNGLGVSGAEVQVQGNNIIVQVPGQHGRDEIVKAVGETAELRFRQVLDIQQATPAPTPTATGTASPGTATPSGPASPSGVTTPTKAPTVHTPSATSSAKGRALSKALLAAGTTSPKAAATTPTGKTTTGAATTPTPATSPSASTPATAAKCQPINTDASACLTPQIEQQLTNLNCKNANAHNGGPVEPASQILVACGNDGFKYALAPAVLVGKQVSGATAGLYQGTGPGYEVDLNLNGSGTKAFSQATRAVYNLQEPLKRIAVVLDGQVVTAPDIQGPIDGGRATISGGDLSQQANAERLASILKFGALPVSFKIQSVESVSATLGNQQLIAGLEAGAIGLGLVLLYSLFYYRALGLVAVTSLLISGVTTYATVTLLGVKADYRLSLAGIAGFIVAVGITADSFVVYFERLRDEIREGRSLRSGVERAWVRARRTIISADVISLLAAVILYFLSVGDVRGFAFTLGLSTVTDLFVVFCFTKPLITYLSRTKAFGSGGGWTGLGRNRVADHRSPAGAPTSVITSTPQEA